MDVQIDAVVCLELERSLDACGRERRGRGIVRIDFGGEKAADLAQARPGVVILLGVIVAGNPVGGMVTGHCKLRCFFGYYEIVEIWLSGEFIPETDSVVIGSEAYLHRAVKSRLTQADGHFIVVVADFRLFAPDRLPHGVDTVAAHSGKLEAVFERKSVGSGLFALLLEAVASRLARQVKAETRRGDHLLAFEVDKVGWTSVTDLKRQRDVAVRRFQHFICF